MSSRPKPPSLTLVPHLQALKALETMVTPPREFGPFDINNGIATPLFRPPPLHHERHLSVIVIGAGPSGLLLAYKLQRTFRNVTLKILEKNDDVGGAWCENNYPGCATGTPSHNYTYSFEPKLDFEDIYSSREDVLEYLNDFATNHGLRKYCKFKHRVITTRWMGESNKWFVAASRTDSGEIIHFTCDILVNACGYLGQWNTPKLPGLRTFQGVVVHSSKMDEKMWIELEGKNIGVVGNGATAAQIIPIIQPIAQTVINFVRQPVYVASQIPEARELTCEEVHNFAENPGLLLEHRRNQERFLNSGFQTFVRGSHAQYHIRSLVTGEMRERLSGDLDLADTAIPDYEYGARPVIFSDTYLEALLKSNVTFKIANITSCAPDGVFCQVQQPKSQGTLSQSEISGQLDPHEFFELDVLIFATGFTSDFLPNFPIECQAGDLRELWRTEPHSYLGIGVADFPNYLSFLGPNSLNGQGASVFPVVEAQADYMCYWLNRWQTERIAYFSPKAEAVAEFIAYKNKYMSSMVWSNPKVNSWYKASSAHPNSVTALWPGSFLHCLETIRKVRADDWNVVYKGNRFNHLGSGTSQTEADLTADWAYYVREHDFSMGFGAFGTSTRWDREKLSRSGTCSKGGLNGYVWNGSPFKSETSLAKDQAQSTLEDQTKNISPLSHPTTIRSSSEDDIKSPVPKRLVRLEVRSLQDMNVPNRVSRAPNSAIEPSRKDDAQRKEDLKTATARNSLQEASKENPQTEILRPLTFDPSKAWALQTPPRARRQTAIRIAMTSDEEEKGHGMGEILIGRQLSAVKTKKKSRAKAGNVNPDHLTINLKLADLKVEGGDGDHGSS